jgi:PhnB protein
MENVIPYLIVRGAAQAIEFYTNAFGAKETFRMEDGGRIGHAEIQIGESKIMLADEHPEMGYLGPQGRSPVTLVINTADTDAMFARAVAAGAKVEREPKTQFYGDRNAGVIDPFGHTWYMSTHVEDVSEEEMERRMKAEQQQTS